MEEEIDLVEMFKYIFSKKILIIVTGVVCIVLAVLYTNVMLTPEYSATSKFILTDKDLETEAEVYVYEKLPDRYYAIANSKSVLDKVIENLKLDIEDVFEFKEENIKVTYSPTQFIITVSVVTDDAKESAQIANEIVKVTIEEIKKVYKDEKVLILDYAVENWEPENINLIENIVKFVLIGEILVCAYILIRYMYIERKDKEKIEDVK